MRNIIILSFFVIGMLSCKNEKKDLTSELEEFYAYIDSDNQFQLSRLNRTLERCGTIDSSMKDLKQTVNGIHQLQIEKSRLLDAAKTLGDVESIYNAFIYYLRKSKSYNKVISEELGPIKKYELTKPYTLGEAIVLTKTRLVLKERNVRNAILQMWAIDCDTILPDDK